MTDKPDRQDDGLLPCPLCQSINIAAGTCFVEGSIHHEPAIRCGDCGCRATLKAWNTRPPSRDAAEGAEETDEFGYFDLGRSFYEEFTRLSNDGNFKGFICGCSPVEILVHLINERDEAIAAPPKHAPDAMREALKAIVKLNPRSEANEHCRCTVCEMRSLAEAALPAPVPPSDALRQNADHAHDQLYGFAPVPPADGVAVTALGTHGLFRLVNSALNKFNKTIPSDDAWTIANEIFDAAFVLSPPAVAAEPEEDGGTFADMLWKWFDDRGCDLRIERRQGLSADDFKIMLDEHEAALTDAVAPVRGDREAIARKLDEIAKEKSGVYLSSVCTFAMADAVLPVQPGAGERP